MKKENKGIVFDIKRYAIHDGPGIRTLVFLKGCPMQCQWCANPESQTSRPEISHLKAECLQCKTCVHICPEKAVTIDSDTHLIDRNACTLCRACAEACPTDAMEVVGTAYAAGELFDRVIKDAHFWAKSSGGLTLSGGEPLFQPEFVKAFLKQCKKNYIHTAVETCLYTPINLLKAIQPLVDYFLCDLKIMDPSRHRNFTGVTNQQILENAAYLLRSDQALRIRMPLIPGINDDTTNLDALGRFIQSHRPGAELELLPYHRLGKDKYHRLNRPYALDHLKPPTPKMMNTAIDQLKSFNLDLIAND